MKVNFLNPVKATVFLGVLFFSLSLSFALEPEKDKVEQKVKVYTYKGKKFIEKIDDLLLLLKEQFEVMHYIASAKWNQQIPIVRPDREAQVFAYLEQKGVEAGLDRKIIHVFFQAQIDASKIIQEEDFRRWRVEDIITFKDIPDLELVLMPKIERLRIKMIEVLKEMIPLAKRFDAAVIFPLRAQDILVGEGIGEVVRGKAIEPLVDEKFWKDIALYERKITLEDVLTRPEEFDNKTVIIEGEVIGEPLGIRQSGVWLNLSAGGYNLGVFLQNKEILEKIKYWGSYKEKGDYVKIEGVFNKDCKQHQERDFHLSNLEIVERGFFREGSVAILKIRMAIMSFIICLTMALIYFIKVRYARRSK